jgi:imidazole glycerol-phosphate synthase subunit HisH
MTIAIVDYGAGNLTSVKKAFEALGHSSVVTSDPTLVLKAERIVVPGVGHFAATTELRARGLKAALETAMTRNKLILGICLGMQWMFGASDEASEVDGWGVFPGSCGPFPAKVKSPHVGWNQLSDIRSCRLLQGIREGSFVYFTHSYRAPLVEATVASCEYGEHFSAVVEKGNVFGVQFHPEKSGAAGKKILQNFCELAC